MKRACLILILLAPVLEIRAQHSLIWKVSGNGLTRTSYIMGTLKFIGENEYYLQPNAIALLKESKLFAVEDQVDHHAQHEMNTAIHFPKGQSLSKVMPPADYKKLKELFLKQFNVKGKAFEKNYGHIKPLALSFIIPRLSLGEKVRYYDIELLEIAKQNNLHVYSLEAVEREAEALNTFSMEDQVDALRHAVNNFETQKQDFRKMMTDYRAGNLEEIFEFSMHPIENHPNFVNEFYLKRNQEWLPKIDRMIREHNSFICLGIAHLEGDHGIIKLLEKKGYKLTPVPVN
jgi:uncharacterized protein YbaP (TraB family)